LARYFLKLVFDGSNYCGWQIQPGVVTVQETIEKALRIFVPEVNHITGCGRTDTGVHASEYYAHFTALEPLRDDLLHRLNLVLPRDIAVKAIIPVADTLHARFSARLRQYQYHVHFFKDPFAKAYSAYFHKELDVQAMNEAARYLLGNQDFSSFARSQTQTSTNYCIVSEARWENKAGGAVFTIEANRFLRNMVRAIVGTSFLIGEGKLLPTAMVDIIAARDRSFAGKSAYPQGLFLTSIHYPTLNGAVNR